MAQCTVKCVHICTLTASFCIVRLGNVQRRWQPAQPMRSFDPTISALYVHARTLCCAKYSIVINNSVMGICKAHSFLAFWLPISNSLHSGTTPKNQANPKHLKCPIHLH
ncbi:hypothetical protein K469DRAFT_165892 [Zopfia rhizophila CBS 207.26]|uniref:Uncharacterized protein n=1 Tax=Zopfia rhizophila CBS 207.26 TaxID=1314779 RepID=A0A6A6E0F4_9PEZI|nr:hypothetical protein K469DRAFT_165892 [Zopfia rhizophila CBS 207.26]